jgi:hypothetical protein
LAYLTGIYFRGLAIAFAIALFGCGLWILLADYYNPALQNLPVDAQSAAVAADARDDANRAAAIGVWRGDLWAQSSYTYASLLWQNRPQGDQTNLFSDQARHSADRALSEAPHNADVWLFLAGLSVRFNWATPGATAALKMSYYTGPSKLALIPLRLSLAAKSNALNDSEIQQFVQRDLHIVLSEKQELKPAIIAAFHEASAEHQRDLERMILDIDPAFAKMLQSPISN